MSFAGAKSSFSVEQAEAGIEIPYQVVVEADGRAFPQAGDAGGCEQPDASGLIFHESLDGNGQHYGTDDLGNCMRAQMQPSTVHAGTFAHSFKWRGHNWRGPSDTGNKEGRPFPPGDYKLQVRARGRTVSGAPFVVDAKWPIKLVP
ncbi:MAG TPA: hypothetical protein VGO62_10520 [Myxococcota bacterium]